MEKRKINRFSVLLLVICLLFTLIPSSGTTTADAAVIYRGNTPLSQIILRRVWFQALDPVFKVDHYNPVELAEGLNVTGIGTLTGVNTGSQSDGFLAPMKEFFTRMGGSYEEDGDTVTMGLNGDVLVMTVGSAAVTLNGAAGTLPTAGVPRKIKVKEQFDAALNPLADDDLSLVYLPVRYILNAFQAELYWDSGQSAIYAVVKVITDKNDMTYLDTQGVRLDSILGFDLSREQKIAVADNILALQNEDGGFMKLAGNVDMAQEAFEDNLGIKRGSSIEGESTVTELRFLAKLITEYPELSGKYAPAFEKGLEYLLNAQMENGGWSFMTGSSGYNSTIAYADNAMISVLTLLDEIADGKDFAFARETMGELAEKAEAAVGKGIECILATQILINDAPTGWSSHHNPVSFAPEIGRSYERPGINAAETARIAEFLMGTVKYPKASQEIKNSVESAIGWLKNAKISNKKMITVSDYTMNNGIERFLVDEPGNITWARNYKLSGTGSVPFFSDRQFTRGDIPFMNYDPNDPREVLGTPNNGSRYSGYTVASANPVKVMLYETRTAYEWYIETPGSLINETYPKWLVQVDDVFTVTFDYNGGAGEVESKEVTSGEAYGELPEATYDGYTFAGWSTDGTYEGIVTAKTLVAITEDHTLTAIWESKTPDRYTITFEVTPEDAELEVSDEDGNVVEPSENDRLVYILAPGSYEYTAGAEGYESKSGTFEVTGVAMISIELAEEAEAVEVKSIKIDSASLITLKRGTTLQLRAIIDPEDATIKDVTWKSNVPSLATVDENGLVTAGSGTGTALITVTAHNGKANTITIRITV